MDDRHIEQLTEEALDALQSGDLVRAVAITDQLKALVPDDPATSAIRAEALLKADVPDEAVAEGRRAVELNPENYHVRTLLGLAAWRAGKLTLAQESLQQAIDLSGHAPGRLADYAWFMAAERGPRLAEEAANEAIVANHKSSTAWAALGLAQFRLRRRKRAEASLTRALQLDPNDPYAQSAMVTLLQDRRDDASAIALADLLTDTPGTEHLVEAVRKEAKKRQIEKKLVERGAMQAPDDDPESPRKFGLSLALGAIMTAGLLTLALTQPQPHPAFIAGAFSPLLLFLLLRRLLD
ncbi:MAG: tetratricopeptide repeat protein [Planctomycetes bacterium]|nr:tetratricopeptide repeat protein [Planctomycetota bacterium]